MARYVCILCLLSLVFFAGIMSKRNGKKKKVFKEGDIKLVGTGRGYKGTILVYHRNRWGAVCDEDWGRYDANVVCRQLGFFGALSAPKGSKFGIGRKRIFLLKPNCEGIEKHINDCPDTVFSRRSLIKCPGKKRTAGVICFPRRSRSNRARKHTTKTTTEAVKSTQRSTSTTESTTLIETMTTSTKPTQTTTMATVTEITAPSNKTITITTPSPTTDTIATEASAITLTASSLASDEPTLSVATGNSTEAEMVRNDTDSTPFGEDDSYTSLGRDAVETSAERAGNITAERVEEAGVERGRVTSNYSLPADGVKSDSPAGVAPSFHHLYSLEQGQLTEEEQKAMKVAKIGMDGQKELLLADAPKDMNVEIRMAGGRYDYEGYIMVRANGGKWGAVCSDHWTIREAMVTCNHIGTLGKAKQALVASYFGGSSETKIFYSINCVGRETNISKCNFTKTDDQHVCSKKNRVAGVVCSDYLPDLVPNLRALQDSVRLQDQPLYYLGCSMEENCLAKSAYILKNTSLTWRNNLRRLLRFSTVVYNHGNADFRPFLQRSLWQWHECHMHYHSMEVFSHYDIMDDNGTRLAEGSKASFCLEDSACDQGVPPKYNCRGFSEQGLSVNCSDNYMYNIDCQWIDITDIEPGDYTFLLEVNPGMLVAESSFENNVVSCHLYYSGYFASLKNCQYHSLLDYRRPIKRPD